MCSLFNTPIFVKTEETAMQPDTPQKLKALQAIYRIHGRLMDSFDLACRMGCSTCCTRNVALTSLEAYHLTSQLGDNGRKEALVRIHAHSSKQRLIPAITINTMATRCMNGEDLPEEHSDPAWGPCPLLEDGLCTIYPIRPFACRSMASQKDCSRSGMADMSDFMMTVNNVFMQYLEHLDQGGIYANLSDLLPLMALEEIRGTFLETGRLKPPSSSFLENRPVAILMVPPEHRQRITPILEELQTA
jgi:Fe-S-cluster containining protein